MIAASFAAIESRAQALPWARERAWRTATHVRWRGDDLEVDLHDLSVPLALEVVDQLPVLGVASVRLVTGRGRHSAGLSPLRDAVTSAVRERGWVNRPSGPGALVVRVDGTVSAPLPVTFWFVAAAFTGAALLVAPLVAVPALLLAATLWAYGRRKAPRPPTELR